LNSQLTFLHDELKYLDIEYGHVSCRIRNEDQNDTGAGLRIGTFSNKLFWAAEEGMKRLHIDDRI
jgi:hypothetical protein